MDLIFFILLTYISNFLPIRCYLLYNLWAYFIHNLYYKNLQFKQLIDDIAIDLWFLENFACIKDIRRKYNTIMDLSKFTSNKKILSEVIALGYTQFCDQTLFFKNGSNWHIHLNFLNYNWLNMVMLCVYIIIKKIYFKDDMCIPLNNLLSVIVHEISFDSFLNFIGQLDKIDNIVVHLQLTPIPCAFSPLKHTCRWWYTC